MNGGQMSDGFAGRAPSIRMPRLQIEDQIALKILVRNKLRVGFMLGRSNDLPDRNK